ncbi:serine/threonine-protein kinase [Frigoriglobus tundricola]|uniref:Serine/threonine protein kinase PrkC, regulator of stationary phase n=1 Tax=Frigoriglobus tundricola TaxID=2774151 RepID=A0A6M5YV29_9BACT|nr:serine/threonine-protein kinase [Frigoriglobus tundricola]QJW97957.1 Serine/threonine protein kinase PrkC, regulator of stationary phase [Frigoriglobus tundricola]
MATHTRLPQLRSPFLNAVRKSGLLTPDDLISVLTEANVDPATTDPLQVAALLVRKKLLTKFQAMQLLNGRTNGFVLDQYKILDGIRQDRVGMVFKAEDTTSKRIVSVKVLPTDRASDPTILQAFIHEVRAAAKVQHPAVARVLDIGYWQGTHFVVSEYVGGPTLDKLVAEKGPMVPHAAAQLVAQAAVGLMHAHECGLIHRDVKPGNMALLPDRRVKLIDLGLTHMLESPWAQVTKRIRTSEYAEEIAHIAPEQAWGCELDGRSDVYSLGSTFYYLLTGQVPFPGLAPEMMAERQIRGVPSPLKLKPNVPKEMDAIVQRMGAKDPHARYQSARAVVMALQSWLPVSQWQMLGLSDATRNAQDASASDAKKGTKPKPDAPAKTGGVFAAVRRLFGR